MKKNWNLSLVLVYVVLGVLLVTSFNTQQRNRQALETPRKKDLIESVQKLETERDELRAEIEYNRRQIAKYETIAARNEGVLSSYTKELEKVRQAAGLTPVKGRGVVVTLGDNPNYPKDDDPNNYIIHDYDIRLVVNSLWAGGARAVSVNNQRLISTSSVRCAGTTVLVNSERLGSPYTIKAVGDPAALTKALNNDTSTRRLLNEIASFYGLQKDVKQGSDISVPGYSGGLLVESARVVEGGN